MSKKQTSSVLLSAKAEEIATAPSGSSLPSNKNKMIF